MHAAGKKTARERIAAMVDPGSFEEYDAFKLHRCHNFGMEKNKFLGDGIVTNSAKINGRRVTPCSHDTGINSKYYDSCLNVDLFHVP